MTQGVCDDLRVGGTLAATGISGGTSINSTAIQIADWSSVLGYVGFAGTIAQVNGRPGGVAVGDLLGRPRFLTLNMRIMRIGPASTLIEATECEQLLANTDDFLRLVAVPEQLIELDMADGTTRFTTFHAFDRAPMIQPLEQREISLGLISSWPYWREGGQENTDTINGPGTIAVGGSADVYDAVLVFSGDGTFTHNDAGWSIEVVGSGGPVTVDLGARTVTEGGSPATNRIRRSSRDWGWLVADSINNVTTDVSVDVTWRNNFQ